ncbi:MAG: allophanate hydrolase subunit 1, partial [Deinococcales bacterium]
MRLRSAGPAAWYVDVADAPSPEAAVRIGALQRALLGRAPGAVRDVVPGYTNLLIEVRPGTSHTRLRRWLEAAVRAVDEDGGAAQPARRTVTVRYGEDADRGELETRLGLPWERIAALHAGALYTVAFLGFTPGFPYLLGLPHELVTPRRDSPRPRVPAGSVAIAGEQAGIYPSASPGGWWVLGRTDERLFESSAWPPTRWAAGDEVRFAAADRAGARAAPATPQAEPAGAGAPLGDDRAVPALEVHEAWLPSATVQAGPRWRVGHFGMAQAGALDPTALQLANRAVG